jgi:hypothetical protein
METDIPNPDLAQPIELAAVAASRSPSPPSRISPSVRPADAPTALIGRSARRAWASEVNRVARRTGDIDQAREAGAWLAMAAIDCDAALASHIARARGQRPPPITLSRDAERRRWAGGDQRIADAIMRDEPIDWTWG